ncbi:MAG: PD-(D/E)XK nuclease family protein [Candidatus Micrarchaeia archaeon]
MSVLEKLHKSSISITDIASQYWCEKQMELNYLYGKRINNAIRQGRAIHEELEEQVNIPIVLQPKSYADALYRNLYTSYSAIKALKENGKTREVNIYGSANGFKLVGKIDQLEIKHGMLTIIEDKTRSNDNIPTKAQQVTHKIQVMLYYKMLSDIKNGAYTDQNFSAAYKLPAMLLTEEFKRQLDALGVPKAQQNITQLSSTYFNELRTTPQLSDILVIRYINQFTGNEIKAYKTKYNSAEMSSMLQYVMKYWNGERQAMPVPEDEQWKCKFCVFYGKECKAWWPQKVL